MLRFLFHINSIRIRISYRMIPVKGYYFFYEVFTVALPTQQHTRSRHCCYHLTGKFDVIINCMYTFRPADLYTEQEKSIAGKINSWMRHLSTTCRIDTGVTGHNQI